MPLPNTLPEQLEEAIDFGIDGIIVYVDQAGQPPVTYAAGWHNKENRIPAFPTALFKIASIGKLYVAASYAQLAATGRISLEDTLTRFYPELDHRIEFAGQITIRHLLMHRSGIPNFTDNPNYPWGSPPQTSDEALAYALDLPADFYPGTDYAYSNTNYLLLGNILDTIVGYSRHQYMREAIYAPLQLYHTYGHEDAVDADSIMSGYVVGWAPDVKGNNHGSMLATAEDVGVFLRALHDGSLLSPAAQALYDSVYVYDHTGLVPGYQSIARYHPTIDAIVVQFISTSGGDTWTLGSIIYNRIIDIIEAQTPDQ